MTANGHTSSVRRLIASGRLFLALFALASSGECAAAGDQPLVLPNPITAAHFGAGIFRGVTVADLPENGVEVYTERDFADLAATGANLVRVFLHLRRCTGCTAYDFPDMELRYVERLLARGEKYGFRVVISLLPLPGFAKAEYWSDAAAEQSIAARWQQIAQRLRYERALAAYDLINEPVPTNYLPDATQRILWRSFATDLITAIRAADPDHVVIFEPSPWAFPSAFKDLTPLPFPNIVYSVHVYQPRELTHQGLYEVPFGTSYPSAKWNKAWLSDTLEPIRQFVKRTGAPIFVGEFSCIRWAPDGSAARYVRDVIDFFEAENWSWVYLGWRGYQGWDAEIPPEVPRESRRGILPEGRIHTAPVISVLRSAFQRNPHLE